MACASTKKHSACSPDMRRVEARQEARDEVDRPQRRLITSVVLVGSLIP